MPEFCVVVNKQVTANRKDKTKRQIHHRREMAATSTSPAPSTDGTAKLTAEQAELVATPFAPGTRSLLLAPAGSGKSTVLAHLIAARSAEGLRSVVVCQFNATIEAMQQVVQEQGLPAPHTMTLNRFAKEVVRTCHVDGPSNGGASYADVPAAWAAGNLDSVLPLLQGVFAESGEALRRAVERARPRPAPGGAGAAAATPMPRPVADALDDLLNRPGPPEALTWGGLFDRWAGTTGLGPDTAAWAAYAARVGPALHVLGDGSVAALLARPRGRFVGSGKRPRGAGVAGAAARVTARVSVWDFVMQWQVATMVRLRAYDPFYNVHRLELAWYPHRFDWARGRGQWDVLVMDEAQDMPMVDSLYMAGLHVPEAWNVEAWYAGDPHQQIHDYRGSVNMLQPECGAVARVFRMTTNFRNPKDVASALHAHIGGLPLMQVAKPGGRVQYLLRAPPHGALRGALVMFRGNCPMLLAAARYYHAVGEAVCVSEAVLGRIRGAWTAWSQGRPAFGIAGGARAAARADWDDLDEDGLVEAATDAAATAAAITQSSERGFREAFDMARGSLRDIMATDPRRWLQARGEALPLTRDGPPLFTTVHSCKGQGHPDVVLMRGVLQPSSGSGSAGAGFPSALRSRPRSPVAKGPPPRRRRVLAYSPAYDDAADDDSGDDDDDDDDSDDEGLRASCQDVGGFYDDDDTVDRRRKLLRPPCAWGIETPEGRLAYVALSRSSNSLRIVVGRGRPA